MDLSVVTRLYRSEPYLENFYRRICLAAEAITADFEMVLVHDGSPDAALNAAVSLFERDARVRVIDLSRTFGHHRAIMTGLSHARGDLVFLTDCDRNAEPQLLAEFHRQLAATGADVVYGTRLHSARGLRARMTGAIFSRVLMALAGVPVPRDLLTVRLMTKRYVHALVQHRDREIFLAGLWHITGFRQIPLPIVSPGKGSGSFDAGRKVATLVSAVTSFSSVPLICVFYLGVFMLCASFLAALYLVIQRVFFGTFLFGWPSLIVSIWMLGGLTIFCIGIIGIYLSKIFIETKDRPYTIIREIYQRNAQEKEGDDGHFRGERGNIL